MPVILTEAEAREFVDLTRRLAPTWTAWQRIGRLHRFPKPAGNRLVAILFYLQEITATKPHGDAYRKALEQPAIGVEHDR